MSSMEGWNRSRLHCIGIKICGRLRMSLLAFQSELARPPKFCVAINFYILDNLRLAVQQ
jgi:hypothetical protein